MMLHGQPFPIVEDIYEGESGHGYVLRMATANLLNGLPAVKAMLGKSRFAVLDAADSGRISRWFGANERRLAIALGWTGTGGEPEAYEIGGTQLTRSYFINRSQPRVCGDCLAAGGMCKVSWEISAMTACHAHQKLLVSDCQHCGKPLRWDRPHVAQCRCGWVLYTSGGSATTEQLDIAAWIDRAFLPAANHHQSETQLGRLIDPLSLDAGLHILHALSAMSVPSASLGPIPIQARRGNSLLTASRVIMQAAEALEHVRRGVGNRTPLRIPSSAVELLAEAASGVYTLADRSLAHSLLVALPGRGSQTRWSSRFPQLSQLSLF